ncbi:MAG: hypothetical protein K1060chlam5_00210 [Candidatus Anoxychlamydiales bacterium]|nr:hypothetical protein [Candidatus Anoxychlamydiales bacterium]
MTITITHSLDTIAILYPVDNINKLIAKIDLYPEKRITEIIKSAFPTEEREIEVFKNFFKNFIFLDLNKAAVDSKTPLKAYQLFLKLKKENNLGVECLDSLNEIKEILSAKMQDHMRCSFHRYIIEFNLTAINRLLSSYLDILTIDFVSDMVLSLSSNILTSFAMIFDKDGLMPLPKYNPEIDRESFEKKLDEAMILFEKTKVQREQNFIILEFILQKLYFNIKDKVDFKEQIKVALVFNDIKLAEIYLTIYNMFEKKPFEDFIDIAQECQISKAQNSLRFIQIYLQHIRS